MQGLWVVCHRHHHLGPGSQTQAIQLTEPSKSCLLFLRFMYFIFLEVDFFLLHVCLYTIYMPDTC